MIDAVPDGPGTYVLAVARGCDLADSLPGSVVPEFGASDCDCAGHLVAAPAVESPLSAARTAGGW